MSKVTCEWCGFKVFKSDYEICPICNYQNTVEWMLDPFYYWVNWDKNLIYYQKWTIKNIWLKLQSFKWFKRDSDWKVLNLENFNKNKNYYPGYMFKYIKKTNSNFYIKQLELFNEAQKYNPDSKVHIN